MRTTAKRHASTAYLVHFHVNCLCDEVILQPRPRDSNDHGLQPVVDGIQGLFDGRLDLGLGRDVPQLSELAFDPSEGDRAGNGCLQFKGVGAADCSVPVDQLVDAEPADVPQADGLFASHV